MHFTIEEALKAKETSIEEVRSRLEKARQEVIALCKNKKWRMSVPAKLEDSDLTIMNALKDLDTLVYWLEAAHNEQDALREENLIMRRALSLIANGGDSSDKVYAKETLDKARLPRAYIRTELEQKINNLYALVSIATFQLRNFVAEERMRETKLAQLEEALETIDGLSFKV